MCSLICRMPFLRFCICKLLVAAAVGSGVALFAAAACSCTALLPNTTFDGWMALLMVFARLMQLQYWVDWVE